MKLRKINWIAAALTLCLATLSLTACSTCKGEGCIMQPQKHEHLVGAYSKYVKPTAEELALFAAVYQGEPSLTPVEVASQVVAGVNYSFRCKSTDGTKYEVKIFQPLPGQGNPRLISVVKSR